MKFSAKVLHTESTRRDTVMFAPLLLLVGLTAAAIAGIPLLRHGNRRGIDYQTAFGWAMAVVGTICALTLAIMWLSMFFSSYVTIQNMGAFYSDTRSAYEYTIEKTQSVVVDISGTRADSITDFSYQEQGKTVSERIREFRDQVEWYNKTLRYLQAMNRLPVLGGMYADVPPELQPIQLQSIQ